MLEKRALTLWHPVDRKRAQVTLPAQRRMVACVGKIDRDDVMSSASFVKRLLLDQQHIRRSEWRALIKRTQLDPLVPLFRDRESELARFFLIPKRGLWALYLSRGFPNSARFRQYIDTFFTDRTTCDGLKKAYEDVALYYSTRQMLSYERYTLLAGCLDRVVTILGEGQASLSGVRVLDYGCGISDAGLLLALLGSRVTICDLDDSKLDFARWRYQRRGLRVEVVPLKDVHQLPEFETGRFDLIVAIEVFEHVPHPLRCLEALTRSLRDGGLLIDSTAHDFDKGRRGDHLKEAADIGMSPEYRSFHQHHYVRLKTTRGASPLFQHAG